MERKETYPVEAIFKHVGDKPPGKSRSERNKSEVDFDGDMIKMNSQRYHLFKHKGCKCKCGVEGTFFAKERNSLNKDGQWHLETYGFRPKGTDRYHFNLYGYRPDGTEVMLTKDHIVPKSKGGPNHFDNYEPMCADCNTEKADKHED